MKKLFSGKISHRILTTVLSALLLCSLCLAGLTGCSDSKEPDYSDPTYVEITMEDGGVIKLEVYPNIAPITCENFLNLVKEGFYDGLTFHRVINNFMIQGGDPLGTGSGGSGKTIKGEFSENGVNNPLSHKRGVISMARSQNMDSASSQFFICHADSPHLDGTYAAFGMVTEGMDVVDAIAGVETDAYDKPLTPVLIKTIRIVEE